MKTQTNHNRENREKQGRQSRNTDKPDIKKIIAMRRALLIECKSCPDDAACLGGFVCRFVFVFISVTLAVLFVCVCVCVCPFPHVPPPTLSLLHRNIFLGAILRHLFLCCIVSVFLCVRVHEWHSHLFLVPGTLHLLLQGGRGRCL